MPEKVDECVKSVLEENPEYSESRAYAICNAAKNKGQLEDGEIDIDNLPELEMSTRINVERTMAMEETKRIDKDENTNSVRYTNITLLSPGEWTDAKSRTTYYYSPEGIRNSVDNWEDNKLHLNHDGQDTVLADIGHVDTDSVYVNDKGEMVGDIVFHRRTQQSRDAEALMELAYDTEGAQGLGGPSVEIVDAVDEWDSERGLMETVEMTFSGVGLVTNPASQTAAFDTQFAAMKDNMPEGVRLMQKAKGVENKDSSMSDGEELDDDEERTLKEEVESLKEQVRNLQDNRELAHGAAVEMLQEYVGAEDTDPSDTLGDVMAWMESQGMDPDEMAYVQEAGDALASMEDVEQDTTEEIPVGMALDVLQNMEAEMEEDEDEEEDKEMSELESEVAELREELNSVTESVSELSEVTESVSELANVMEDMKRDLEKVKDQPVERGLSSHDPTPNEEGEDEELQWATNHPGF